MPRTKNKQPKQIVKIEDDIAALQEENLALKQELEALKGIKSPELKESARWRSFFAGFFAIIAIISLVLFNAAYWTRQTVIDNKQFVATVSPIIKDADVQKALQTEISKQIFAKVNVEEELKNALPDNLDFIAAPFAAQVQSFVTGKIGEALQSPQAANAWTTVLGTAHEQLIAYIQNPNNDGKITVDEVYKTVGEQLKTSQVGFLFGKSLPASIGSITVKEITWLPKVRQGLETLQKLTAVLAISTIGFGALALALSRRRVYMLIKLMFGSLIGMLITLGVLAFGSYEAGINVPVEFKAAAISIFDIITQPLAEQTKGIAALLASVLFVAFIASKVGWITWLRENMRTGLDWLFNRFSTKLALPDWLPQIPNNRLVIAWTLTGASFAIFALRLPPTLSGVVTAVIVAGICELALEVISSYCRVATKQNSTKKIRTIDAQPVNG